MGCNLVPGIAHESEAELLVPVTNPELIAKFVGSQVLESQPECLLDAGAAGLVDMHKRDIAYVFCMEESVKLCRSRHDPEHRLRFRSHRCCRDVLGCDSRAVLSR